MMDILQLVALALSQLSLISKDPALGYRGAALTEALGLLGTILAKGEEARAELEALAAHIQEMVDAGREPSKIEWLSLRDQSRQYHDVLNPPPPETEEIEPTGDK